MVEQELKDLIISRYGSLKKFSEDINIAWSTLDGVIKRGANKANITSLIKICEGLSIDCESLYYGRILPKQDLLKNAPLNLNEENIIKKYRDLDNHGKDLIDTILLKEYDRCIKETEEIYYPKKYIDRLPNIASAGIGDYLLDDIPIEKIEVDNDCQADFAIGIDGDSMNPTYNHNDVVLVKRQNTISIGEIGIFIIDGDCFIKEYAKDRLISHNKDYPDKIFNECMDIRLVGKVVGKLN